MVFNILEYIAMRILCFINDIYKVLPLGVAHQLTQFPCNPAFHITGNTCYLFKLLKQLSYLFLLYAYSNHGSPYSAILIFIAKLRKYV